MTISHLSHAAEDAASDEPAALSGAPVRTLYPRLPAIDDGPGLTRLAESRPAIPGFDGDDEDGAPIEITALVRQVESAADAAVRAWPDIQRRTHERTQRPDASAHDVQRELKARAQEIEGLEEIKRKQATALRQARDEIVSLDDQVRLLRARLTQQEKETAAANKALQRADADKTALGAELEQTNANFAELLRQTADLNTAFGEREKEVAAVRQTVASLKAELKAKAGDTDLMAAIEEAKTRYYKNFEKRYARFEAETEKLARMVGARDERVATLEDENAQLSARCDALAAKAAALEAARQDAQTQLDKQTATVTFLDTALQAERDASAQKIAELTAALRHERLARAAEARESAVVCKEIVQLLPRLARHSGRLMDAMEREVAAEAAE